MSTSWRPRRLERRESLIAGLVASAAGVAAGLAAFYLARIALARDELPLEPPARSGGGEPG
ncbi:MAG: hypothetical protein JSU98_07770 [Gemmatimonadales bacterium]|nr:MAG: hypothetical protein JSU98_07770 [Gemmatimonadales bacterium]